MQRESFVNSASIIRLRALSGLQMD